MNDIPKRRGRPPVAAKIAGPDGDEVAPLVAVAEEIPETAPVAEKPTRRRARGDIGGMHLKLAVPERVGFRRRWVNDDPGRIAMFERLAYEPVKDPSIRSEGSDTLVRRLVGTTAGGAPLYAYLMETPEEEYQYGVDEKEEGRKAFEAAIRRGEDTMGGSLLSSTQSHKSEITAG